MEKIKIKVDNPLDKLVSIQLTVKDLLILDSIVGKEFSQLKALSDVLLVDENLLSDFKRLSVHIHMESACFVDM